MNDIENYAHHILQKHKLATAIAILRSKPSDVTTQQYIEQLTTTFTDGVECDVTACYVSSGDFDVSEYESQTILNDFNDFNDDVMEIDYDLTNLPDNVSQTTFYESQEGHTNITDQTYVPDIAITHENFNNIIIDPYNNNNAEDSIKTNTELLCQSKRSANNLEIIDITQNNIRSNTQNDQEMVYTQNYTHYSQSQINMSIPKNLLFGTKQCQTNENNDATSNNENIPKNIDTDIENIINTDKNQNSIDYLVNVNNPGLTTELNKNDKTNINSKNTSNTKTGENGKIDDFTEYSNNIGDYINEVHNISQTEIDYNQDITETSIVNEIQLNPYPFEIQLNCLQENSENDKQRNNIDETINISNTEHENVQFSKINDNNEESLPNNDLETEYSSQEIVPFKILEELNKVKKFLNRDRYSRGGSSDGYSTDTGYRSDSQTRSSNKSVLLSETAINQSAHSLFNYLIQCHLVARDITYEIAQVFGQLIDKLHEEERYPTFLEDLLDNIDNLLKTIYESDNSVDNEFLHKEENIERLFLLNTSLQIQQHTIDQITNTLQVFHNKITEKNDTYELTNANQIENICYIFHILETILTKHIKTKNNTHSSQNYSQEDLRVLKKSSIVDIWKKKWNPQLKNDNFEYSKEKKCVLKNCSEVLNKIIVDCVNEYSLVSYLALKCFNLMQS